MGGADKLLALFAAITFVLTHTAHKEQTVMTTSIIPTNPCLFSINDPCPPESAQKLPCESGNPLRERVSSWAIAF